VCVVGDQAGQLIGKRGSTINEIRGQSQARIQVMNDDESRMEGAVSGG
jgi:transcription antitermination factor NusA-like protein